MSSRQHRIRRRRFDGKRDQEDVGRSLKRPKPYRRRRFDDDDCVCRCDFHDHEDHDDIYLPSEDPRFMCIPGIVLTSSWWPFLEEMIANSNDKIVVAIHPSREIDDTRLLQLFEPFGQVISAKIARSDRKPNRRGGLFGFVTFVNKEDAQQAIRQLNGSGPHGSDQRILNLVWAQQIIDILRESS